MFSAIEGFAGTQPFNDWFTPDTVQRHVLGTCVKAVDPFWGMGEFVYLKAPNDATVIKGSLVTWNELFVSVLLPTTAGQGFSFGVAMAPAIANTFYWAQISGYSIMKQTSDVAADVACAVAGTGLVGALANGKQLCNARVRKAAAATKTVTASVPNNSSYLVCPAGYDGLFLGMALSGTGIAASTVVAGLDPDGKKVYLGSAIGTIGDKLTTAAGSITLTGTFTGYLGVVINRPFAQGQVV